MPEYEYPRPALTADAVTLRFRGALEVLLIERAHPPFQGSFALPGGYVDEGETPREAAIRELAEETGVSNLPLYEIGAFGGPGRDPRGWVVTSAWLALAQPDTQAQAGDDAALAQWFPLSALPALAFDHAEIIEAARRTLHTLSLTTTAPLLLLQAPFRTRTARTLYNEIHGTHLPPRAFKAWLRHRGAVERVGPAKFKAAPQLTPRWLR